MKFLATIVFMLLLIAQSHAAEPVTPVPAPFDRITDVVAPEPKLAPFVHGVFMPDTHEVIVFTGSENVVIEQRSGWIETALTTAFKPRQPLFRHMGWEGDTVYRQNRMMNWGTWKANLDAVGATTIVAWFGQMEALDGTKTIEEFTAAYAQLLDEFAKRTPRIVLISPPPFEKPMDARIADNTGRNTVVGQYVAAAKQLAAERGYAFIDIFTPLSQRTAGSTALTRDGIHFTDAGLREVSAVIAAPYGAATPSPGQEAQRAAIVEKNRLWFDAWRCMNYPFAYGDRTDQPFAKATGDGPRLVAFIDRIRPLVAHADAVIQATVDGGPAPAPLPAGEAPRPDPPASSPDEEMSRFKLRDGFAVNLFADEKLGVVRALQMRWDDRGRLWALCTPSYPLPQLGERANDFLLVLEDTDGDGRADKATRFAEGLTMPMGFEFGDGGVYICESTQLIHLRDRGDGKAGERRVVLSGFGTGDTHQDINSIRWGADGCLWFTQGYHIWSYVETPYGVSELNRSGIWRFNPRTLRLDSFLNDSGAGLNCWGVAFDDFGQLFHGSGADYEIWYTTPALIRTLHPLLLPTGMARSAGKSLEPEFLGSSHLPDDLRGAMLKSIYFTSQVGLYRLSDNGSGFRSEALGDLMASSSNEFRPVESRVGPDGAIYVCDWLNPVIGHYQASYRDPRRDRSHGRIWRLTAKDRPLLKAPDFTALNAAQLIELLASPERWIRDQAQHLLYQRAKAEVIPAADAALAKQDGATPASAQLLYELSGVFCAHEEPRPQIIDRLLASADFRWRCWGVRLIGMWSAALPDALARLGRSIVDQHPRVRLEAIVAASQVEQPEAVKVATMALDQPMDPALEYALTQCIHALAPLWQDALVAGTLDFGSRGNALQRVLTTIGGAKSNGLIRKLMESSKPGSAAGDTLLVSLIESGDADDLRFAVDRSTSPEVLAHLATVAARDANRRPTGDLDALVAKLLTDPAPPVRSAAHRLAAVWRLRSQLEPSRVVAEDAAADPGERAAAIAAFAALAAHDAVVPLLVLAGDQQVDVRIAAVAALAQLDVPVAAKRIAELLAGAANADEAGALVRPILAQKGGPATLAKALETAKPSAATANLLLAWLSKSGRDDAPLIAALNAAAGIAARPTDYDAGFVAKLVAAAKARGDAAKGGAIFHRPASACLACHKVGSEGGVLGPELTVVGRGMTPELIVEAVLWPKRQVKEGFLLTRVTTKDGRFFQGYRADETADRLTLRDPTGGPSIDLRKKEIANRQDEGTLMPDGLTAAMSEDEIVDLVRYLMDLGR